MNDQKPMVFARVSPEVRDRVRREAGQRFQGNESMLVRAAVETYLDLRESLGFDFDRRITEMLEREAAVA